MVDKEQLEWDELIECKINVLDPFETYDNQLRLIHWRFIEAGAIGYYYNEGVCFWIYPSTDIGSLPKGSSINMYQDYVRVIEGKKYYYMTKPLYEQYKKYSMLNEDIAVYRTIIPLTELLSVSTQEEKLNHTVWWNLQAGFNTEYGLTVDKQLLHPEIEAELWGQQVLGPLLGTS